MPETAELVLGADRADVMRVTRPGPWESWVGTGPCPMCGLNPIRVRAYSDDPPGPSDAGYVTAIAWCAGVHSSVGYLREPPVVGGLRFMGVVGETVRCRIYSCD